MKYLLEYSKNFFSKIDSLELINELGRHVLKPPFPYDLYNGALIGFPCVDFFVHLQHKFSPIFHGMDNK
jgi:hypothetical protein